MNVELQPLMLESSLTMQKILEAADHQARCKLLKYFMDAETRRLESKKTLKGLFSSNTALDESIGSSSTTADMPAEEMISESDVPPAKLPTEPKTGPSTFFDDEDAFQ